MSNVRMFLPVIILLRKINKGRRLKLPFYFISFIFCTSYSYKRKMEGNIYERKGSHHYHIIYNLCISGYLFQCSTIHRRHVCFWECRFRICHLSDNNLCILDYIFFVFSIRIDLQNLVNSPGLYEKRCMPLFYYIKDNHTYYMDEERRKIFLHHRKNGRRII